MKSIKKMTAMLTCAATMAGTVPFLMLSSVQAAETPANIYGDVDENGIIDCSDITTILRFATLLSSGTSDNPVVEPEELRDEFSDCFDGLMKYADINRNGLYEVADATYALRLFTLLSSGATAEAEEFYTELTGEEIDFSGTKNDLMLGDINENGKLDVCDAVLVEAYVAGLSSGISMDEIGNKMPYVDNIKKYISYVSNDGTADLSHAALLLRNVVSTEEGKAEYEEYKKNSKDPDYMMGMDEVHRVLYDYGITIDF